jgi:hypothetical protein
MTPEHDRICYLCGKPGGNPAAWSLGELGGRGKFAHAGCVSGRPASAIRAAAPSPSPPGAATSR